MKKNIDTRGYSCPEPVLMTKNAIEADTDGELIILTDTGTPKENVTRFAEYSGYTVEAIPFEDGFRLSLKK